MPALKVLVVGNFLLGDNKIAQELALRLPKDSQVEFSPDAAEALDKVRLFSPNAVVLNFSMALVRIDGEMLINTLVKQKQIPVIAFGRIATSQQTAIRMGARKYVVKSSDPLLSDHFYHLIADEIQALDKAAPVTAASRPRKRLAQRRLAPRCSQNRLWRCQKCRPSRHHLCLQQHVQEASHRKCLHSCCQPDCHGAGTPWRPYRADCHRVFHRRHGGPFRSAARAETASARHCHRAAYPRYVLKTPGQPAQRRVSPFHQGSRNR